MKVFVINKVEDFDKMPKFEDLFPSLKKKGKEDKNGNK